MTARQLRTSVMTLLILFSGVGVALVIFGAREWRLGQASSAWPRLPARLLLLESGGSVGRGAQRVRVEYEFETSGVSHRSRRVCFGLIGDRERTELAALSPGSVVQVSVDPVDAMHSVLLAGVRTGARIITFAGALVLAFVGAVGVFVWRDPPWRL